MIVYDAGTGSIVSDVKDFFSSGSHPSLLSTPGTDTVFAASGNTLYEINAGADTLSVLQQRTFSQSISNLALVRENNLLAVQLYDHVDLVGISDLSTEIILSYQSHRILATSFAGGRAYLAASLPSAGQGSPEALVMEFQIGLNEPDKTWEFESGANLRLAGSHNDSYLYVSEFVPTPDSRRYWVFSLNLN